MFPGDSIGPSMNLQDKNLRYAINFGMKPFFQDELVAYVVNNELVVHFDDSLNNVFQKEYMDFVIRFLGYR